jgi:very-short-patch-repair endonuclease
VRSDEATGPPRAPVPGGPTGGPKISEGRRRLVDTARKGWIKRLIDLSRRNPLLFFRDLKIGTLDFSSIDRERMAALLQGDTVGIAKLFPEDPNRFCAIALEIHRRAVANLEERGLDTLFLAVGFATWPASDGGRDHDAPVLLVPMVAEARSQDALKLALRRSGEIQVNPVLLHVLVVQQGVTLAPADLISVLGGDDPGEAFNLGPMFTKLAKACHAIQGFSVSERATLGNFSFQKMAMVKDLQDHGEELAAHDLIAAVSGDQEAQATIAAARHSVDPQTLDAVPPDNEFLVMDADSSQQTVIAGIVIGQDGVIHGPPGTGKSQTIANVISELAARGKRVLFVAEKRAALDVVLERLRLAGLGELALDLHGADLSRREILKKVAESFQWVREATPAGADRLHQRFSEIRSRLLTHLQRVHAARHPSGQSVYDITGEVLRLPGGITAETRWRSPFLDKLDASARDVIEDLLVQAAADAALFLGDDPSPWTGAQLADGASVQQAADRVARLARDLEPEVARQLDHLSNRTGLRRAGTLKETAVALNLLGEARSFASTYREALFHQNLELLAEQLEPARSFGSRLWAFCVNSNFRDAGRRVRGLRHNPDARVSQLLAEVSQARELRRHWRSLSTGRSTPGAHPDVQPHASFAMFVHEWNSLRRCLPAPKRDLEDLADIATTVRALAADGITPYRLPQLIAVEAQIVASGAQAILEEIRRRRPDPAMWSVFFRGAWLMSCLDRAFAEDPGLAAFNGRHHDQVAAEFRKLDEERLQVAVARVRREHGQRAVAAMNANAEGTTLLRREAEKSRRHLPFRKLVEDAGEVLVALRPCWMASPLSVSQLLPARRYFDVVLFDEASQVLPEDAVPAILRGSHTVVAGDQHQLPPTAFFAAGEDEALESDEAGASEGFESVLNLMMGFTDSWKLDWHYRSTDEALIAFSNRHIYGERLVTFPGVGVGTAVDHVLVTQTPGVDGQEESVAAEAEQAVRLVLAHAQKRPKETLGVIAMGIRHAQRVQAALDRALRDRPELEEFFDQSRKERFFVKNLERVQGDERDAIILTIGYGKDAAGKLPYRFGPLLTKGGERRLNVAITRARNRLTLVSSFSHLDMDPGRSRARGVELLRLYLEYATTKGARLGDQGHSGVPLNHFEQDVYDTLTGSGVPLEGQWGASRYRIDLVAKHPRLPGRFVLAIECDGASYHSAYTARDRDRLRQQHLERLGWRFHRIWSTDWYLRKSDEVWRAVRAWEQAVAWVDAHPPGVETAPATVAVTAAPAPAARPSGRGPRPGVPTGLPIDKYDAHQLIAVVQWIRSDGHLRTDDELVAATMEELGFHRRGSRIVSTLADIVRIVGQSRG